MKRSWRDEYRRSASRPSTGHRERLKAIAVAIADGQRPTAESEFKNGMKGRRRRRSEASDEVPDNLVTGSLRNGVFSSIKTGCSSQIRGGALDRAKQLEPIIREMQNEGYSMRCMAAEQNRKVKTPRGGDWHPH